MLALMVGLIGVYTAHALYHLTEEVVLKIG